MFFIATIQPHRVVRTSYVSLPFNSTLSTTTTTRSITTTAVPGENTAESRALSKVVDGTTACLTSMIDYKWKYGDLRGGTAAVYIGENRFLTFFHSSNDPPPTGNVLKVCLF